MNNYNIEYRTQRCTEMLKRPPVPHFLFPLPLLCDVLHTTRQWKNPKLRHLIWAQLEFDWQIIYQGRPIEHILGSYASESGGLIACREKSCEGWKEIILSLMGEFQKVTKHLLPCNILKRKHVTHELESSPPKMNNHYRVNSFHNKTDLESWYKVIPRP